MPRRSAAPVSLRHPATDLSRRDWLRVGSLGLSANLLPGLSSSGLASTRKEGKAKSVIFLWMAGGVTHIDSFDPKPEAPEEIRGTLSAIDTALPGVQFSECTPHLARMADKLCVVRSFSHDSNDHLLSQVYTLSGRKVTMAQLFSEPNIGSLVSHLNGPRNGFPGYIAVPGITRPGPPPHNLFVGGWLGQQYAPFCVGGEPSEPDFTKTSVDIKNPDPETEEDLTPPALELPDTITADRLMERSQLRRVLDQSLSQADKSGVLATMDSQFNSAMHLLLAPEVRAAFDLDSERELLNREYGRTKIGARCLLARRLVEGGAPFVMVDYGYDPEYGNLWDNHAVASQNQPHISEMCKRAYHVAGMDRAFAALINDLEQRGLLDSTLVVFLTEFGRTPKINANGGRDHWGAAGSIFFTGAGTQTGQIIGATDKTAAYPTTIGYTPADIAATIYHGLGIDPETRVHDLQDRPVPVLPSGAPIPGVLG